MGKNSWIALLLALLLLAGTALPVLAAGTRTSIPQIYDREDDYGGLAPPPENNTSSTPSRPAGEGDNGGIAPSPEKNTPASPSRPAGEGDNGGVAPSPENGAPASPSRPAGEGDNGGIAPSPENGAPASPSRPAGEGDNGGVAPSPENGAPASPSRPAGEGDNGGVAPSQSFNTEAKETVTTAPKKQQFTDRDVNVAGKIPAGVSLTTSLHTAYLYGSGGAFPSFSPTRQVTRAEAALMLYRLLPQKPEASGAIYSDLPTNALYADAVTALADLGVMEVQNGLLDPTREITRGEFVRYIASFFPLRTDGTLFDDVSEDDPNAPFIVSARSYGWAQGDANGLFKPDEVINRAAAVVLLNRALGRTADKVYIDTYHPAFFVDVSPSSWYYYDVIEAAVGHEHSTSSGTERWTTHTPRTEVPKDGLQLVDGWLYYYDSSRGDLVRNASVGTFDFNNSGRFTTGNNELDSWLHKIVIARTNSSMTQEEMLRALYLYTRDSFTYLRRPPYEFGAHDFMEEDALRILETGYGNCYCYASLLWYLTRWIGYDSIIYSGTVGQNRAPHSWVEINMDGRNYIFDAELEMAYRRKKRYDVNLYKFYDAKNSWNYRRPTT